MNRTHPWRATEEMLESDKCQEKLITGKVRCQGITCCPSWGDTQTDKLSGRACTACTTQLCSGEEGAAFITLSLFHTLSMCRVALGVVKVPLWSLAPEAPGLLRRPGTGLRKHSAAPDMHGGGCPARVQDTQREGFSP